jgi:hypothetical protein
VGGVAATFGYNAYKAVNNPAQSLRVLGLIKRNSDKFAKLIQNGTNRFLNNPITKDAVIKSISTGILEGAGHFTSGNTSGKSSGNTGTNGKTAFDKRVNEIKELATNPNLLMNTLVRNTSGISENAPLTTMAIHTAAMQKINILNQAIPKDPNQGLLNNKFEPNPEQIAQFERIYNVVTDTPKAIFNGLTEGTLTPDMVSAANAASPKTMEAIRHNIVNHIMDNPKKTYSYEQKLGMSLILGKPVSSDCDPSQIAFQQSVYQNPGQSPGNPGQSPGKPRAKGLDKIDLASNTAFGTSQRPLKS